MTTQWLWENDPEKGGGEYPYLSPQQLKDISRNEIFVKAGVVDFGGSE